MSPDAAPRARAAFDTHVDRYEEDLARGLSLAGESKAYFARGRLAFLRAWWTRTGRPEPERVVDFGCGPGDVAAQLADVFPKARVLGVDPSERCVARAAERYAGDRVAFETLDPGRAPVPGGAQLVHVNGVVHHVAPRDRPELFAALARETAPDGVLAVFENNPLNPGARLVMARIPFDRDAVPAHAWEVRRRLRDAGLAPVHTGHLFFFPRWLRALRPIEPALASLPLGAQYGVLAVRAT